MSHDNADWTDVCLCVYSLCCCLLFVFKNVCGCVRAHVLVHVYICVLECVTSVLISSFSYISKLVAISIPEKHNALHQYLTTQGKPEMMIGRKTITTVGAATRTLMTS